MIGIYCIENLINHKKYVGQSVNIKDRWATHKSELKYKKHHNNHLQRSWDKYGSKNFSFSVIEECSAEDLNEREVYWIAKLNTTDYCHGYNSSIGGNNNFGENSSSNIITEKQAKEIINMLLDSTPTIDISQKLDISYDIIKAIKQHRNWCYLTDGLNFPAHTKDISGERNPMYGRKQSPETIRKIIENQTVLRGEDNPNAILTESKVLEIINLLQQGISLMDVSKKAHVKRYLVGHIAYKKTWKYLTEGMEFPQTYHINKKAS